MNVATIRTSRPGPQDGAGKPGGPYLPRPAHARRPLIPLPDRPIEYPPFEEEPETQPDEEETPEPSVPESPEIVPSPEPVEPEPAVPARTAGPARA